LNLGRVIAASGHCIQVNQMKMPETVLPPGKGNADRIWNSDELLVVGSGDELDAGAASQIERRNCDHRARGGLRA